MKPELSPGQICLRGLFAEADDGTLRLDKIGELPLALQAMHFLRDCAKRRTWSAEARPGLPSGNLDDWPTRYWG